MKILYVIGSMQVGGAERHLFRVASELAQSGHIIDVFAFNPEGPLKKIFQEKNIRVRGFHAPAWLAQWVRHKRIYAWIVLCISAFLLFLSLWSLRPKIVHFFLPAAYVIGGLVSIFAPPCVRIMSRRSMNYYQSKYGFFTKIERWLHPRMNMVTGNSKAVVEQLEEEGISREHLRLIYNGIDATQFERPEVRGRVREQLALSETCLVIIMVANLIPYKGHIDLVQACAGIKHRMPDDWILLLVGRDDGIQNNLESESQTLGVFDHIRFLGSRKDIPDLLSASDIGVLCSHEEGFSNAILEAMAAGLPMVVTDVGGNAEAVVHGETGLVVPARQPAMLGEAMLSIALDENRQSMGHKGHMRVKTEFSLQACMAGYESMYADVIAKKSA